jgi:hypothetical protein
MKPALPRRHGGAGSINLRSQDMLDFAIPTAADGSTISFTDLEELIARAEGAANALAPLEDQVGDLEAELDGLESLLVKRLFALGRCFYQNRQADEAAELQALMKRFRTIWGDDAFA